ncbi:MULTISPECIES: hypothetical protein [unclassified Brevundimonas]|uniref:hypothetical protein n=1 Tax=unclassified Brevundimonas TaxID=2622653 RepID=UPI0025C64B62|nr:MULTISPECIES: hypothetical protein [unclassified Brevundimonas]
MSAQSMYPARYLRVSGRGVFWRSAVLAAALLGFASAAEACDLALVQGAQTARIEYNPFAVAPTPGALDVTLENRGETECDLRLSFTDETGIEVTSVVLGGIEVRFRPRESSGVLAADVKKAVFQYLLAPETKGVAQLDAIVARGAVAEAGEYGVDLRLLVRNLDGVELIAPIPVRLLLQSTPRAQLNLAGAAGAFGEGLSVEVVDFGEAVTGATRRIFVQVRANAPSILSIKSEHQGVMHRVEEVENATVVPYAVELDGQSVDLTGLWTKEIDPPRTLAGVSLPMNFILGQINGQMSGRYEDLITIDVYPK